MAYLLALLLLGGCAGEVVEVNREVASAEVEQQAVKVAAPVRADTTPPRPGYIIDRARPKAQINSSYPYDIPLKSAAGQALNSSEVLSQEDQPVVLLFWLTTCYPCRMEMKAIAKEYEAWQQETPFQLVAISTDFQKNFSSFTKMVEKNNWPWLSVNDVNREFRRIMPGRLNGLPQLFVLDKNRKITYHKRKYQPGDEKELFRQIQLAAG